jgi:hypothetical protein
VPFKRATPKGRQGRMQELGNRVPQAVESLSECRARAASGRGNGSVRVAGSDAARARHSGKLRRADSSPLSISSIASSRRRREGKR